MWRPILLAAMVGCGGNTSIANDCPNAVCSAGTLGTGGGTQSGNAAGRAGGGMAGGGTAGSGMAGSGAAGSSPGALDLEYFKCRVEPILDRGCSMLGCHGTETARPFRVYSRGRMRNNEQVSQVSTCPGGARAVNLAQEGTGTVMCVGWSPHTATEWRKNFDNARTFATPNPDDSDLLAQPVLGGRTHAGVHLFSRTSQDYQTIRDWLSGAQLGRACNPGSN